MTILFFGTGFCAPCRAARSVLKRAAESAPKVTIRDINAADEPELAMEWHVTSTPTIIALKEGNEQWRLTSVPRLDVLRELLTSE